MTSPSSLILICPFCRTRSNNNMDIVYTILWILCSLLIFLAPVIVIWYVIWRKSHPKAENSESLQNREYGNGCMSTRTQEISSTARYQESPINIGPSNSSLISQNSQQSLRVNLPPEIILTPSQHIITNQEYDKPPSYESLYNLF